MWTHLLALMFGALAATLLLGGRLLWNDARVARLAGEAARLRRELAAAWDGIAQRNEQMTRMALRMATLREKREAA